MSVDLALVANASNSKSEPDLLPRLERFMLAAPLIVIAVAGCSLGTPARRAAPPPVSAYAFDYTVSNGKAIDLVRAFSGVDHTYLQFRAKPHAELLLSKLTSEGTREPVAHSVAGNYAVVPGVHQAIEVVGVPVSIRKHGFALRAEAKAATLVPMTAAAAPSPALASPTDNQPKAVSADKPPKPQHPLGTHIVRFAKNTSKLGPRGKRDVQALAQLATVASTIEIRTRAAFPARRASVKLAERRARTIRAVLVSLGVAAASICMSTEGAQHALAVEVSLGESNSTGATSATTPLHRTIENAAHQPVGATI